MRHRINCKCCHEVVPAVVVTWNGIFICVVTVQCVIIVVDITVIAVNIEEVTDVMKASFIVVASMGVIVIVVCVIAISLHTFW